MSRNTAKESEGAVRAPVAIRLLPTEREELQRAAEIDTEGNVSEFVRRAVRARIQRVTRNVA